MRKQRYSEHNENTPWNASLQYIERLERRNEDCDEAKIDGQLITYYRVMETLFLNTHMFFNEEEKAMIRRHLETCKKEVKNLRDVGPTGFVYEDAEDVFDALRYELNALLHKYELTYVMRKSKTWEDEIEEDFK